VALDQERRGRDGTRQDLLGDNGGRFAFDGLEAAVRRAEQAVIHLRYRVTKP
jgi:hypothetical protein